VFPSEFHILQLPEHKYSRDTKAYKDMHQIFMKDQFQFTLEHFCITWIRSQSLNQVQPKYQHKGTTKVEDEDFSLEKERVYL